jgi:hypothetical protein
MTISEMEIGRQKETPYFLRSWEILEKLFESQASWGK